MKSPVLRFMIKHWKWLLPAIILFGIGINVALLGSMKSHPAYKQSLYIVKNNPQVIASTGKPISAGMLVIGTISGMNARLGYKVEGPNGKGEVFALAKKSGVDEWVFEKLEFGAGSKKINLLQN